MTTTTQIKAKNINEYTRNEGEGVSEMARRN